MDPVFANRGMKKAQQRSQTVSSISIIRSEVWRRNHLCLTLI